MTFLATCLAFLLGSFPSGLVLTSLTAGIDIRTMGSGNIGASNVASEAGWRLGVVVGVLDVMKGVLSVLVGQTLGVATPALAIVALAAVLGHDFSLYLHLRGGKGVATTFGVALVLAPLPGLLALLTWVVVLMISEYAAVASLVALALLPVYMALSHQLGSYVLLGGILFLLAVAKHYDNLIRLAIGQEEKNRRPRPLGGR